MGMLGEGEEKNGAIARFSDPGEGGIGWKGGKAGVHEGLNLAVELSNGGGACVLLEVAGQGAVSDHVDHDDDACGAWIFARRHVAVSVHNKTLHTFERSRCRAEMSETAAEKTRLSYRNHPPRASARMGRCVGGYGGKDQATGLKPGPRFCGQIEATHQKVI